MWRGGVLRVGLLELPLRGALLGVELGFVRAVGVDAAFGEVVGAAAGYDEGTPAVAMVRLVYILPGSAVVVSWREEEMGWESSVRFDVTYYTDLICGC